MRHVVIVTALAVLAGLVTLAGCQKPQTMVIAPPPEQAPPPAAEPPPAPPVEPKTAVKDEPPGEPKPGAEEGPNKPGTRVYVVQKGEGLMAVARKELGDARRWKEILPLNPGLTEKNVKAGQSILIPAN